MSSARLTMAVSSRPADSAGSDSRLNRRREESLPKVSLIGNVYHLRFAHTDPFDRQTTNKIKKVLHLLLRQHLAQHFVITFGKSTKVDDKLFSLLIYLTKGAKINGATVGIVTRNSAVRAAFRAVVTDEPVFFADALENALGKLRQVMLNVA